MDFPRKVSQVLDELVIQTGRSGVELLFLSVHPI